MQQIKMYFQRRNACRQSAAICFALVCGIPAFAGPITLAGSITIDGVGNFHQVDNHVYRGAQPTDQGFRNLAKLGVKTVVDLREDGQRSRDEEKTVKQAGMQYVSVPMKGMRAPSDQSVSKALALLEDASTGPVFVHCMRGADRTGNVIACYRIEHYHWKNKRALTEARSLGMSWFEKAIQHYVLKYQPRDQDGEPKSLAAGTTRAALEPAGQQSVE